LFQIQHSSKEKADVYTSTTLSSEETLLTGKGLHCTLEVHG